MNQDALLESLRGKRFALVACTAIAPTITAALDQAHASFATIHANSIHPGWSELDRFDALVLDLGGHACDSAWLRPEALRNHTRPLLLAGPPEAIYCRETLQSVADDVILTPFSGLELLFRLHRITGGKSAAPKSTLRSGKPVVLVADDDRDIIRYLECVLANLNVETHFVGDGQSALAAARELFPKLILLDIGMPIMDGLAVLRCLRNDPATRDLPTVLLTASSDPAHIQDGASLGVAGYILKPFGHINLARKLKTLLGVTYPQPYARLS